MNKAPTQVTYYVHTYLSNPMNFVSAITRYFRGNHNIDLRGSLCICALSLLSGREAEHRHSPRGARVELGRCCDVLVESKLGIPEDVARHAVGDHHSAHEEHCAIWGRQTALVCHDSGGNICGDGDAAGRDERRMNH